MVYFTNQGSLRCFRAQRFRRNLHAAMRFGEIPRPALLPPDIDAGYGQGSDDKPHDANKNLHRQAEDSGQVEPMKPSGEHIASRLGSASRPGRLKHGARKGGTVTSQDRSSVNLHPPGGCCLVRVWRKIARLRSSGRSWSSSRKGYCRPREFISARAGDTQVAVDHVLRDAKPPGDFALRDGLMHSYDENLAASRGQRLNRRSDQPLASRRS